MPTESSDEHDEALLARALRAIDSLDAELDRLRREPIAVVGTACRFPKAGDLESFWSLLRTGGDAITAVPVDRAQLGRDLRVRSGLGGFLDDPREFDADFFGISPREAETLDPQQRLLLEVAWEALEDAHIPSDQLFGTRTGVFIGISTFDYALRILGEGTHIDPYAGTGSLLSPAAGRLSYVFGFQGPSLVVDTACSSSLVAVHQACQSLRAGECDAALAGGVNRMLDPALAITFGQAGMLAADGHCKPFAASADGFVRSEGCGVVLLKRLSDALAANDQIHAVLRGSAVNQDGRSSGLMAPNGPSQQAVIRQALVVAGVSPGDVAYVETHGTGTRLGDPIEAGALMAVYGDKRPAGRPIIAGALKSNLGHMEAASGIGGVIKTVLAIENGEIPPNLHVEELSPEVALAAAAVHVPTRLTPWPAGPRLAGVSAFGFAGTNAHMVVGEAPDRDPVDAMPRPAHLLALSAKSREALRDLAGRYLELLSGEPRPPAEDICFWANNGRTQLQFRLAVVGRSSEELCSRLETYLHGCSHECILAGDAGATDAGQPPYDPSLPVPSLLHLAQWWVRGGLLDWRLVDPAPRPRVRLPHYPWQRKRYWLRDAGRFGPAPAQRPFLGQPLPLAGSRERRWVLRLTAGDPHPLAHHRVLGTVLMPASSYIDGLLAAAAQLIPGAPTLEQLEIVAPLVIAPDHGVEQQLVAKPAAAGSYECEVYARPADDPDRPWTLHTTARIQPASGAAATPASWTPRRSGSGDAAAYYADAARRGLQFGPAFRRLTDLVVNDRECVGEIAPLEAREQGPDARTWDACFQLCDAILQQEVQARTWLPVGIDRVHLVGTRSTGVRPMLAVARRQADAGPDPRFSCRLFDGDGALLAELDGIRLKEAPPGRLPLDGLWYHEEWRRKDLSLTTSAHLDPTVVGADLREIALEDPHLNDLGRAANELEGLSDAYVLRLFSDLGWRPAIGEQFTATPLQTRLGIQPRFTRLFQSLLAQLAAAGFLEPSADVTWRVRRQLNVPSVDAMVQSLERHAPAVRTELKLLTSCGSVLSDVLHGLVDPVEVLFPCGQLDSTEAVYREAPAARFVNRAVAEVVRAWLRAVPDEQRVRVLEVGAGSGATTSEVLPALGARVAEYMFTDISPRFLTRARGLSDPQRVMRFGLLDLDADPNRQGFGGQQFDLVIAANVLHATRDVRASLRRLSQLAGPGALLVVVEPVATRGWVNLTFGLSDGWWHFEDDLRTASPLLNTADWLGVLNACGYEASGYSTDDLGVTLPLPQALFVARKPVATDGVWLVVGDRGSVGAHVVDELQRRGREARLVEATRDDSGAIERAVGTARDVRGVVCLSPLDATIWSDASCVALEETLRTAAGTALETLGVVSRHRTTSVRLVTRGALGPGSPADVACLPQTPVVGLARVAALELSGVDMRHIDLDPHPASDEIEHLCAEILMTDGEPQSAWRDGFRWIPRVVRSRPESAVRPPGIAGDRTYVVAGGTSGLGLLSARWLIERGARHVVIAGRRGEDGMDAAALGALRGTRATVRVVRADLTDFSHVETLFTGGLEGFPALGGVLFAAGVLDDGVLEHLTWERLRGVLAPKTIAAWNIWQCLRESTPDWLVLYSSVVSLVGNHGQATHAAANAFLDAFARVLRRQGIRATVVNWGPTSVGAATRAHSAQALRGLATRLLSPDQVFDTLDAVFAASPVQAAVMDVDWSRSVRRGRLLDELIDRVGPQATVSSSSVDLLQVAPRERRSVLLAHLRQEIASVLGLDGPDAVEPRRGFFDIGMDSLTSLELRTRLETAFGLSLPSTYVFSNPTPAMLAGWLAEQLQLDSTPGADVVAAAEDVPARSVEELARLIDREIAWLEEAGEWDRTRTR